MQTINNVHERVKWQRRRRPIYLHHNEAEILCSNQTKVVLFWFCLFFFFFFFCSHCFSCYHEIQYFFFTSSSCNCPHVNEQIHWQRRTRASHQWSGINTKLHWKLQTEKTKKKFTDTSAWWKHANACHCRHDVYRHRITNTNAIRICANTMTRHLSKWKEARAKKMYWMKWTKNTFVFASHFFFFTFNFFRFRLTFFSLFFLVFSLDEECFYLSFLDSHTREEKNVLAKCN